MELALGLLVIRVVVGLTLAGHGAQKAFGAFGGPGLERWKGAMTAQGFRPPELFAYASAGAELVGGILFTLGLLTPIAAGALVVQMWVAIRKSHLRNGFWNTNRGVEFPLGLLAACAGLGIAGPGAWSLDAALGLNIGGALAFVVVAAAGFLVTLPGVLAPSAPGPRPAPPAR